MTSFGGKKTGNAIVRSSTFIAGQAMMPPRHHRGSFGAGAPADWTPPPTSNRDARAAVGGVPSPKPPRALPKATSSSSKVKREVVRTGWLKQRWPRGKNEAAEGPILHLPLLGHHRVHVVGASQERKFCSRGPR